MSRKNSCSACTMIAAGVKFRKSPKHTCDNQHRLTFRLPKFLDDQWVEVIIQRGGYVVTEKASKIRCQKQEIEGVKIPNGFEIWVPQDSFLGVHREYSSRPSVSIKGWKINQILKFLVMGGLRNGSSN